MYTQYLLGQLTEADRDLLEERLFEDDQAFALLNLTEDELIEDYLFDRLSPESRAQFEAFYLQIPAHQQKLKLAQSLHQKSSAVEGSQSLPSTLNVEPSSPPVRDLSVIEFKSVASQSGLWSRMRMSRLALAASILLSLIGLWLIYSFIFSTRPVPPQQGHKLQPVKEPPSVPAPSEPSPAPDPLAQDPGEKPKPDLAPAPPKPKPDRFPTVVAPETIASVVLLPSLSRGNGQEKQIILTPQIKQVQLELVILDDDSLRSAIAVMKHPDGNVLWKSHVLPVSTSPAKRTITVKLNPAQLTAQTCLIELHPAARDRQSETIATYTFKVVRVEPTPKN